MVAKKIFILYFYIISSLNLGCSHVTSSNTILMVAFKFFSKELFSFSDIYPVLLIFHPLMPQLKYTVFYVPQNVAYILFFFSPAPQISWLYRLV